MRRELVIKNTYYAYEHDILMQLQDKYKIKNICKDSDKTFAYAWVRNKIGELEKTKAMGFEYDYTITFNFEHDFKFAIKKDVIQNAYERDINSQEVVDYISNEIEKHWLMEIKE